MLIVGSLYVMFTPGTDGAIDLVVTEMVSETPDSGELIRVALAPEELSKLITQGQEALWEHMELS